MLQSGLVSDRCEKVYFPAPWEQGSFESNLLRHGCTNVERLVFEVSVLIEEEEAVMM